MTLLLDDSYNSLQRYKAKAFCKAFCCGVQKKYILGRNVYVQSVTNQIDITAFIDDYCKEQSYLGKPIIKSMDVPKDALVLVVSGGKPLTAKRMMEELGLNNLDYFSFYKYSGLSLRPIVFNENFNEEFDRNIIKFEWIFKLLSDDLSKHTYQKLINFRYQYNLDFLQGFMSRENKQYFEEFLLLKKKGEVFVDVGGFNGFTSQEFIKHCPDYSGIYIFEPDSSNYQICREKMQGLENISIYQKGLSNEEGLIHFSSGENSVSRISDRGFSTIEVTRLDSILKQPPTLIKIDVEGAELLVIDGAVSIIKKYHPRLAICVYHHPEDFWQIPENVLKIREDYSIFLRHYTESIYETVMFFLPIG